MTKPEQRSPGALEDGLSIDEAIAFFERNWIVIVACPVALATAVLIVVGLVMPRTYVSAATLVVVPPAVSSQFQPPALSVHAYKTLLQSDSVLSEAIRRLTVAGEVSPDKAPELGQELRVRIFVSRKEEATSLAPILEAVARAEEPGIAAAIANTWAQVFLERVRAVAQTSSRAGLDYAEQEFPKAETQLKAQEDEWLAVADEYEEKLQTAATDWDRRVVRFGQESEDLLATYNAQSRSVIDSFLQEHLPPALAEVGDAGSEIGGHLADLAAVRAQMAQTPAYQSFKRAMSDDALWDAVNRGQVVDRTRSMLDEEANPVHNQLALMAIKIESTISRLVGGGGAFTAELQRELEKLQQQRSAGAVKLREGRNLELAILSRRQERELSAIHNERKIRLDQVERELDQLRGRAVQLAGNYSEALLSRAQENVDAIHLASPAARASQPEDRRLLLKVLLAGIVGSVIGLALALVREAHVHQRDA